MTTHLYSKHGLEITKEIHNCKIDCCPDRGKTLYTIKLYDNKTTLSESEFQEIINKLNPHYGQAGCD